MAHHPPRIFICGNLENLHVLDSLLAQWSSIGTSATLIIGPDWSAAHLSKWVQTLPAEVKKLCTFGDPRFSIAEGLVSLFPKEMLSLVDEDGLYPYAPGTFPSWLAQFQGNSPFASCVFMSIGGENLPDIHNPADSSQRGRVFDPQALDAGEQVLNFTVDFLANCSKETKLQPGSPGNLLSAPLEETAIGSDLQPHPKKSSSEADAKASFPTSPFSYREVLNFSTDLIFTFDQNRKLTYFNPALNSYIQKFLGNSLELGAEITLQGLPGKMGEEWEAYFNQVFQGHMVKESLVYELPGEVSLFSLRMNPVIGKNDSFKGGLAVLRDITADYEKQAQLREVEHRFSAITSQSPVGLFELDDKERVIWLNPRAQEIFQKTTDFCLNQACSLIWSEAMAAGFELDWQKMKAGFPNEIKVKQLNEKTSWLRISLTPIATQQGPGWSGSVEDVTEIHYSHDEILEIFYTSPDLIFVVDWDGYILKANPSWTKLLGFAINELVGANIRDFTPEEDRQDIQESSQVWSLIPEKFLQYKTRIVAKSGKVHWINWHVSIDRDNQLFRGVGQEITSQVEEEAYLRMMESVVTHTHDAVIITKANPVEFPGPEIVFVNEAFCHMTGYEPEEVIGLSPDFLVLEAERDEMRLLVNEAMESGRNDKIDMVNYRKDGTPFWTSFSLVVVKDDLGNPTHLVSVRRDITDQKEAEISIRKFEAYQRSILQNSSQLVTLVDQLGYILAMNKQAIEGFKEIMLIEPAPGVKMSSYLPPELSVYFEKALSRTLRGDTLNGIQEWRGLNGKTYWYRYRYAPAYDTEGEQFGSVFMLDDITILKKQESDLLEMTQRMALATQGAGVGIWEWSITNNQLFWDDVTLGFYQINRSDFKGAYSDWADHVHPEDLPVFLEQINYAILHKTDYMSTYRIIRTDGSIRYLKAYASLQYLPSGHVDKFLGINTDVTVEKEAEVRLVMAKSMAEEMTRLKTNFLANMSHEIRTPINGMMGLLELMAEDDDQYQRRDYLLMMQKSGNRLLNTLTGILELSKLEAEGVGYSLRPIAVEELIRVVVESLTPLAITKKVRLEAAHLEDELEVLGDSRMLSQVLNNIVGNALKFTREGSVRISASLQVRKKGKEFVIILIEDTGIGIAPDHIDKIFQPFKQESEGRQRQYEGVGLGLSIARKYSELLGGTIEVESEKGVGSAFRVILPAYFMPFKVNKPTEGVHELGAKRL